MRKLYVISWIAILFAAFMILSPTKASAAGNTAPDVTTNTGADIHMLISERGSSIPLDAAPSYIMMSWPTAAANFTIYEGCWGGPRDIYTSVQQLCAATAPQFDVIYEFLRVDSNGRPVMPIDVVGTVTGAQAGNNPYAGTVAGGATYVPSLNRYVLIMRASWAQTGIVPQGRNNMFKIRADNGEVGFVDTFNEQSFYPGGSSPIAIARAPTNSALFDDIQFHYQSPCDYTLKSKGELYLRWQDADAGAAGAPANSTQALTIRQWRNNGTSAGAFSINVNQTYAGVPGALLLGGDGQYREIHFVFNGTTTTAIFAGSGIPDTDVTAIIQAQTGGPIDIQAGDRFEWDWSGVRGNNGVQLWAPFNTISYGTTCNTTPPSCSIVLQDLLGNIISNDILTPGQLFRAVFTLTNTGSAPFTGYQPGANAAGIHPGGFDSPPFSGNPFQFEDYGFTNYLVTDTSYGAYNNRYVRVNHIFNVAPGTSESFLASDYQISGVGPQVPFQAPTDAGPWNFNWGIVKTNGGWADAPCKKTFNVASGSTLTELACGSVIPDSAQPGQTLNNITVSFSNGGGAALSGETKTVKIGSAPATSPSFSWSGPPGIGTAISANMTATMPSTPGDVPVTLTVSGGNSDPNPLICAYVIHVSALPYLRVYGGDVRACSGNIDAWGGTNGEGAAGEYGVTAGSAISGFSSAAQRTSAPQPITDLTFANTSMGSAWGGNFGSPPACTPNYWEDFMDAPANKNTDTINLGDSNQTIYNGTGCSAGTVDSQSAANCFKLGTTATNKRLTVFINGDLVINGTGVTYSGSPWSAATLPYITVITCGNIYIDKAVTTVSGWYIALPRAACTGGSGTGGGNIFTCTNGFRFIDQSTLYNDCQAQLTIRGSFTADKIRFLRTRGTLSSGGVREPSSSTNIAEKFIYGAESWIGQPVQKVPLPTTGSTKFESITGLPPVL